MKEPVFIDSSFWIALLDQKDQKHPIARDHLKSLLQNYRTCLSDFIVFETITYLNCSIKRHDLALTFLKKTESPGILLIIVDEIVKSKSVEWFKRYSGKDLIGISRSLDFQRYFLICIRINIIGTTHPFWYSFR